MFIVSMEMLLVAIQPMNHSYSGTLAAAAQEFCYCYYGNMLAEVSTDVANSIFYSKWYRLKDISSRKMVAFALARSQKPCMFSVKGHLSFTLETFGNVSWVSKGFLLQSEPNSLIIFFLSGHAICSSSFYIYEECFRLKQLCIAIMLL